MKGVASRFTFPTNLAIAGKTHVAKSAIFVLIQRESTLNKGNNCRFSWLGDERFIASQLVVYFYADSASLDAKST